jgi:glycerol uptake facilitator-like aquaporin
MFSRKQIAVLGAEFIGTAALALIMLSVQHSAVGVPYFVAAAAGLALATLTIVLSGNGGGHFNPAVTIGMWTVRQIRTVRMLSYVAAQLLGALVAYWLYVHFIKTDLQPITGPAYDLRIMAAEATGAFLLALAYAAAVFNGYLNTKRGATVGAAYALAIILAASATIGIINPAVAFSMRAAAIGGFTGWGTYLLGPILGAIIGFNLYALLFAEESALLRVRTAVSGRLSRSNATPAKAEAVEAPAAPARRRGRPAGKRSTTTRRSTSSRRPRSTSRSRS